MTESASGHAMTRDKCTAIPSQSQPPSPGPVQAQPWSSPSQVLLPMSAHPESGSRPPPEPIQSIPIPNPSPSPASLHHSSNIVSSVETIFNAQDQTQRPCVAPCPSTGPPTPHRRLWWDIRGPVLIAVSQHCTELVACVLSAVRRGVRDLTVVQVKCANTCETIE